MFFKDSRYLFFLTPVLKPILLPLEERNNRIANMFGIKTQIRKKNYIGATQQLHNYLRKKPHDQEAYILLVKIGRKAKADYLVERLLAAGYSQKSQHTAIKYYLVTDQLELAYKHSLILKRSHPDSQSIALLTVDLLSLAGYFKTAEKMLQKIHPDSLQNSGRSVLRILCTLGKFNEAYELYRQLNDPALLTMHRRILFGQKRIYEAFELYAKEKVVADILSNIPLNYSNDFSDKEKNILLFTYYGVGDEIRFASMYKQIAHEFKNFAITCDPRFYNIFTRSFPGIRFISCDRDHDGSKPLVVSTNVNKIFDKKTYALARKYEQISYSTALLKDYRKSDADFKSETSYLIADAELQKKWRKRLKALGPNKKIGICWRSDRLSPDRNVHYTYIDAWEKILQIPGIDFISLQYGPFVNELKGRNITKFSNLDLRNDFDNQAALISELDLVISPCTTLIELCGALGKPGFFLSNSYDVDWRINENNRCMWYDSIKFIRPDVYGKKKQLIKNLHKELLEFVGNS